MLDGLVQSCDESWKWPENLLQSQLGRSVLSQIKSRLEKHQQNLFTRSDHVSVHTHEAFIGDHCYEYGQWNNIGMLRTHLEQHLVQKEKDPRVRHAFISAPHSRAPLNCTLEMFLYLCTYQQVSADFIDLLYSFGVASPLGSNDFHHTRFIWEYTRESSPLPYSIPELGRSGVEMIVGYKLCGMEESDFDQKWTMRQTAVYHSLDISNGKSFWVTVKANGLIRNRIAEASSSSSGPLSIVPSDLQSSLRNALATHLIMLQWCTDGWRWYVSHLEKDSREMLAKTTAAPFLSRTETLDPSPILVRALSLRRSESLAVGGLRQASTFSHGNGDASPIKTCTSEFPQGKPPPPGLVASGLVSVPLTQEPETIDQGREEQLDQTTKRLQVLQDFSLKDLQNLNFTSSKLREAKMVMSMNINILKELREHYWNLLETASVPSTIAEPRGSDMDSFQRRVKLFERCLESECLRADTLMGQLEDGKNLYDMLLQAQKTEIEKLFAMNSHDSSQRMELSSKRMENVTASMHDIAKTTERDTSSMHIITLFTLIFLPGTFLGVRLLIISLLSKFPSTENLTSDQTFFSTPIFGEGDVESNNSWTLNWGLFKLFLEICLPMMVVTVAIWALYKYRTKRMRAIVEKERSEQVGCV